MNVSTVKKSPLSVLNELIRKQKIQFSLINEMGEPHFKTYFMQLKLGNGEIYISSGPSIKKSQHAVAQLALVNSDYLKNSIKADFSNEIELNQKSFVMIPPDNLKYKSDTTILYELASKLKKNLYFKVISIESDNDNSIECLFEEFSTIGYGKSKFEAKSLACGNMLNILKDNLDNFDQILNEIKNYKRQKTNQSILSYNGSAVIAMKGQDCVAIATDLRFGIQLQTISTDFSKVTQFGERIFVGFPGLATDRQTVAERLMFHKNLFELNENKKMRPKTLSHMLSYMLYEKRFGPYFVEPVVAGIDPITGDTYIGGMDLIGCPMESNDFIVSGTCKEQMFGMCETLWEENMDSKQLFECISQALLSSLDRDCSSGWGVRVYLVEKDQVTVSDVKTRMD